MNQLQKVFNYQETQLRTVIINSEPWFVAKDVAKILGFDHTPTMTRTLEDDEKGVHIIHTPGGEQQMTIINEPGLYSAILKSRKPEAKEFKRWITHEVIPAIRKHGAYMTPETIEKVLTDPDTIIKLATNLKEERAKRMAAEALVEKQKPKVVFAKAVETSDDTILVGQLAKIIAQNGIKIGQNRLFQWMRDNGYLGKKGAHYNEPTQYSMDLGLFEVKERTVNNPDGSIRITRTTKVTGKGQIYFVNKFLSLKEKEAI